MEVVSNVKVYGIEDSIRRAKFAMCSDISKANSEVTSGIIRLAKAEPGTAHNNFLSGIVVQFDLSFTNKAWVEFERYHFAQIITSQSTMHRIARFDLDKAYNGYVDERIINIMKEKVAEYNAMEDGEAKREKYLEILYSNPSGMILTAGVTTNYLQLKTMYKQRKDHRLPEWREFCKWIETLPYSDFITNSNE